MRYIPHTEADVAGDARRDRRRIASTSCSPTCPRTLRLGRALDLAARRSPSRTLRAPSSARSPPQPAPQVLSLPRRRRLPALHPERGRRARVAQRVLHRLHAVPARDQPGHAAGDLRVPDDRSASLLGLDVANASMYDGASAAAEAVLMALRLRAPSARRASVLWRAPLHPHYREVLAHLPAATPATSTLRRGRLRRRGRSRSTSGGAGDGARRPARPPASSSATRTSSAWSRTCRRRGRGAQARGALLVAVTPRRSRSACCARPASSAPTSRSAKRRASACPMASAARASASSRTRESFLRADAGPPRRRDRRRATAGAASCSRCRRASSTSAARRRRRTSAPTTACARWRHDLPGAARPRGLRDARRG